jgi:uncharacterized protein (DUF39 family)
VLAEVSYAELKSGKITVNGKEIPTASLSSYPGAVEIASTLREWIKRGGFLLSDPVAPLPGIESGVKLKALEERPLP